MTFGDLREHFEHSGCHLVHLEDNFYIVRNCINGNPCVVQDLEFYDTPTLCHYFLELGVEIPEAFIDHYHVYMTFREHLRQRPL